MEKITQVEILNAIKTVAENGADFGIDSQAVIDYCESQLTQRANKLAKDKERRAEKAAKNDELKSVIAGLLTDELQTPDAIVALINDEEVTKGKVVNRLTKLVEEGVAVKESIKEDKKAHVAYKLA